MLNDHILANFHGLLLGFEWESENWDCRNAKKNNRWLKHPNNLNYLSVFGMDVPIQGKLNENKMINHRMAIFQ